MFKFYACSGCVVVGTGWESRDDGIICANLSFARRVRAGCGRRALMRCALPRQMIHNHIVRLTLTRTHDHWKLLSESIFKQSQKRKFNIPYKYKYFLSKILRMTILS